MKERRDEDQIKGKAGFDKGWNGNPAILPLFHPVITLTYSRHLGGRPASTATPVTVYVVLYHWIVLSSL